MIIELHDDLDALLSTITNPLDECAQGINKIFELMIENKHIVVASRKLLRSIFSYAFINPANKSIIAHIIQHYVDVYSSLPDTNKRLRVVPAPKYFVPDDENEYILLKDCYTLSEAILSTENPNDFTFYCNLFKFMNKNNAITINFSNNSFGGGSAEQFLKTMITDNNIILTICDSDKDFETSDLGSTAVTIARFFARNRTAPAYMEYYILPVREKENLLPIECYELFSDNSKKQFIDSIKSFSCNEEFMKFIDIKSGFKLKKVNCECSTWHKLYDPYIDVCKSNNAYNETATDDDDYCIKGIGGKLADRLADCFFNEENKDNSANKKIIADANFDINNHIPKYIMSIYTELFNLMITYGCVLQKAHNSFIYR